MSRQTSSGPSVFTSGLVKIGVGLAHAQFGSRVDNSWLELVRRREEEEGGGGGDNFIAVVRPQAPLHPS